MRRLQLSLSARGGRILGSRTAAFPLRDEIEKYLDAGGRVEIDFFDTEPTQAFIDELIGVLVMERGKAVLSRLVLSHCSPTVKALIHLVVSDRLDHYLARSLNVEDVY